MSNKFRFDLTLSNFKKEEIELAKRIANANKNYFLRSFQKSAWGNKQWKIPLRRIKGTPEWTYPLTKGLSRRTKPTLVGKGILRRGVTNSIKQATPKRIMFEVDLPYAERHNLGLDGMPQRQFMGWNRETDKITKDLINNAVRKIFK